MIRKFYELGGFWDGGGIDEQPEEGAAYLSATPPQSIEGADIIWEVFLDTSYYDMWAVRPKGDMSFTSESLFHLPNQQEARNLAKYISSLGASYPKEEWFDVSKGEFPETGSDPEYPYASEMILLSDGEFVYYGQYESSKDFGESFIDSNGDDFSNDGVEITHWRPLPKPPIVKQ